MNTQIAYCGVNCFACSDYINKICPSCKRWAALAFSRLTIEYVWTLKKLNPIKTIL